jgi:DnaJ-class molecular chaperone
MGPMIINNTGPCMACKGSGSSRGDTCGQCTGAKFIKQDKILELQIKKGMKSGDTIVFEGESSNVEEYTEPGDVLIELVSADEDHGWERSGDNLRHRILLTLGEALCGKIIKLEGHPGYESGFNVQIPAGVQHKQEITVEGCGMPRASLSGFGDCILVLSVLCTKEDKLVLEKQKETLQNLFSISTEVKEGDSTKLFQAKPFIY